MKLRFDVTAQIISLGMPGFLMQLSNSLLNVILNRSLLAYGGDVAVSGMGIINSIQTILLMPIIGLNQGVQPIISFNYGAKKYQRIKEAQMLAIIAATVIVVIGWIVTRMFPEQIVTVFNQEPELLHLESWRWEYGLDFACYWFPSFRCQFFSSGRTTKGINGAYLNTTGYFIDSCYYSVLKFMGT